MVCKTLLWVLLGPLLILLSLMAQLASGSALWLVSSEILVGMGSVAQKLLSLGCWLYLGWTCGQSSLSARAVWGQQGTGGLSSHKWARPVWLCALQEGRRSDKVPALWHLTHLGGRNLKAISAELLLPFKSMSAFAGQLLRWGSSASLADRKSSLRAMRFHPLVLVPLMGVTMRIYLTVCRPVEGTGTGILPDPSEVWSDLGSHLSVPLSLQTALEALVQRTPYTINLPQEG